ncbi:DUF1569 domain-containing protein [Pontibacter anaerobius]|uniref:DUF1569 domain-containing protein n=1 Tax=Pontibacter anaerobius TaxID=2993940 RepID=A0ABT3RCN4_9BACT|nr:DUF1569 domain-containing protein [Pontibacter anaerobius]MCX2739287.1 DUF1569 domain-containing protein [Pontibacter anaerobius]
MLDIIQDRDYILNQLQQLKPDAQPQFGLMSPQHMVEHLAYVVQFSNGKQPQKLYYRQEKAEKFKQYTIYSEQELVPGFRAPMLGEEPAALEHTDLENAIKSLGNELQAFDSFFQDRPAATPVSPTLGKLNYQEWVIFHSKHFRHHLRQFNLL